MALQPFTNEQLNYFKFAFVVVNEFPKVLRKTFKHMWDNTFAHLPDFQPWDDSITVREMFIATEGGKTKVPTHLPYEEWDCTALFQATIYAQSFALPDRAGHHRTLNDLYLRHRKLPRGTFHSSVVSPGGNNAETFAMAIDQLRLLRNAFCHSFGSEIDKKTFDQYIQLTKDAIKALGVTTDPIDAVGSLTESDFPTKKVCKLKDDITKELLTEITFLKENVEDELQSMRSDLAQARQERQEDSLELRKTIEKATANQEMTNEKIAEVKELFKTERPGTKPILPRSNLPPKVPDFIGREEECDEIVDHLTSESTRFVSIWGSPGFGKTSVAIAVGHHLRARELPVYFLSLRGLKSKSDLTSKFLSLLRLAGTLESCRLQDLSADDELCLIFDRLMDRCVIILDNADDLLESGLPNVKEEVLNLIGEILNRSDKVNFLLTARESLSYLNLYFQGHKSVRIRELDKCSCQTLARELLPGASSSDLTKVSKICGQVPLAIKLLCSSISEDYTPSSQYIEFLEHTENIVEMLDNPDYPSNSRLRSLLESSFQRLSTQDQEALVCLSILPAYFDLKISAAVLGKTRTTEAEKVLQRLQGKSLIDSFSNFGKFYMHKLIQSFAREKGNANMRKTVLISKSRFHGFYKEELNENLRPVFPLSSFTEFYEEEKLSGEEHSETADNYHSVGVTQHSLMDYTSALESERGVLKFRTEMFGEEGPETADSYRSESYLKPNYSDATGDTASPYSSDYTEVDIDRKEDSATGQRVDDERVIWNAAIKFESENEECVRVLPYLNNGDVEIHLYVYCDRSGIPSELKRAALAFFGHEGWKLIWEDLYNDAFKLLKVTSIEYSFGEPKRLEASQVDEIDEVINENLHVFSNYRNVTAVQPCFKVKNSVQTEEPCIAVYVLGKGQIPMGETAIPSTIGSYPVDIVNGFFVRTKDPYLVQDAHKQDDVLRFGTSIGIKKKQSSGTLGAIVKDVNSGTFYALSCDHVMNDNAAVVSEISHPGFDAYVNYLHYNLTKYKGWIERIPSPPVTLSPISDDMLKETAKLQEKFIELKAEKKKYSASEGCSRDNSQKSTKFEKKLEEAFGKPPRVVATYHVGVRGNVANDGREQFIDAAVAKLNEDEVKKLIAKEQVEIIGTTRYPSGTFTSVPTDFEKLRFFKSGSRTGFTKQGVLVEPCYIKELGSESISIWADIPCINCKEAAESQDQEPSSPCKQCKPRGWLKSCLCIKQLGWDPFCNTGDSGAVVFDESGNAQTGYPGFGIIFGMLPSQYFIFALVSPLEIALEALSRKVSDMQSPDRDPCQLQLVSKFTLIED